MDHISPLRLWLLSSSVAYFSPSSLVVSRVFSILASARHLRKEMKAILPILIKRVQLSFCTWVAFVITEQCQLDNCGAEGDKDLFIHFPRGQLAGASIPNIGTRARPFKLALKGLVCQI